jgi:hypothetical protein
MKVTSFLKNKYVFHILVFMGVINILGYIALGNYNSMALFVVICLLSRYFSKNLSLIIIIAILVTSFSTLNSTIQEGFKGSDKISKTIASASKALNKATKATKDSTKATKDSTKDAKCTPENCPKGKCENDKCITGFQNNVPSSKPAPVNNNEAEEIDVAATMEDAYNNLNKMLGDGAMKSMTTETKNLVSQQQDLMKTLHEMTPALGKAKETLENLHMPSMEEMTKIMKKFSQ